MRKFFYLAKNFDVTKGQPAIDDLNNLLNSVGVKIFWEKQKPQKTDEEELGLQLVITVNKKRLDDVTRTKSGRPVEHKIDFAKIFELQATGKTNKEIYTELGISKSLFYLKMREYKNNIGR